MVGNKKVFAMAGCWWLLGVTSAECYQATHRMHQLGGASNIYTPAYSTIYTPAGCDWCSVLSGDTSNASIRRSYS